MIKQLKYTYYACAWSKVSDAGIRNILLNGSYWIASRCIHSTASITTFDVFYVNESWFVNSMGPCLYKDSTFTARLVSDYSTRPIVILKSNVIDTSEEYNAETGWSLK